MAILVAREMLMVAREGLMVAREGLTVGREGLRSRGRGPDLGFRLGLSSV